VTQAPGVWSRRIFFVLYDARAGLRLECTSQGPSSGRRAYLTVRIRGRITASTDTTSGRFTQC